MDCHLLLLAIFLCAGVSAMLEEELEMLETIETSRSRRAVDRDAETPAKVVTNPLAPNAQTPIYLGQCIMCPPGPPGPPGTPGFPLRPRLAERYYDYQDGNETRRMPVAGGVTFTRWGKPTCPDTAELVYHGIMASSHSSGHKGSGSNYLCMPLDPKFAEGTPSYSNGGAVYGVEFNTNILTSQGILNSEATCAVCLSMTKTTSIMIPGTDECLGDQGWTLEYHGYLMTTLKTHFKSEFVCVDYEAEVLERTTYNNEEATLYQADATCSVSGGGLPCPPYVTGYDIICAVCTR